MAVVAVEASAVVAAVVVAVSAAVVSAVVAGSDICLYYHIEKLRRLFLRKSAKFFISASCE